MILDYFDKENMSPQEWEEICDSCYSIRYKEKWQKIPAAYMGDCGIEGYVENGIVYQCYYPEKKYADDDLYEHQRDKLTRDVAKLILPENIKNLQAVLGRVKVKEWHFVVPEYKDKRIIEHANKKEMELISEINDNPNQYPHLDNEIRIKIMQASNFIEEMTQAIRTVNNKVKLRIDDFDDIDYTKCEVDKVNNIKRKIKAINPNIGDELFVRLVKTFVKFYLNGVERLNKLRVELPSAYGDLHNLMEAYKADVEMRTMLNPDSSLNKKLFDEIMNDFETKLNQLDIFDVSTINKLKNEIISGWLADCSMEFIA